MMFIWESVQLIFKSISASMDLFLDIKQDGLENATEISLSWEYTQAATAKPRGVVLDATSSCLALPGGSGQSSARTIVWFVKILWFGISIGWNL